MRLSDVSASSTQRHARGNALATRLHALKLCQFSNLLLGKRVDKDADQTRRQHHLDNRGTEKGNDHTSKNPNKPLPWLDQTITANAPRRNDHECNHSCVQAMKEPISIGKISQVTV